MPTPEVIPAPLFNIRSFEHVGIRVSDQGRAILFYQRLGFRVTLGPLHADGYTYEMANDQGVRVHLVCNGRPLAGTRNVLLDDPVKIPGITHVAFVVDDLGEVARVLEREGIQITEGPVVEPRRRYLFFRDPDGNVIEVNELL